MSNPREKLYVDVDGVRRGYYVYVHKNPSTSEVFYVGKGHGRRAWETGRRHKLWKDKVASLGDCFDVEIVRQDLSEVEAFELEAELVEQYGGAAATGGGLTNWVPGGEEPVSVRLELRLPDDGQWAAYYEARQFKSFPQFEQEAIAASLVTALQPLAATLEDFQERADESGDEKLSDDAFNVCCSLQALIDSSSDFRRRRVPWKDFGLGIEDAVDELELELADQEKLHCDVRPILKDACTIVCAVFQRIDSGNRMEAEEWASRKAKQ